MCYNGRVWTLTVRKNCQNIFSKNVTIDHLGQIAVELGDYFSLPDTWNKLINDGDKIAKISLAHNKFHQLNYTIEMVSYTASKIVETIKGK